MEYIGMCGPKGDSFSAVLIINKISILAILPPFGASLVINRVLIFALFFRRSYFFITPSFCHARFAYLIERGQTLEPKGIAGFYPRDQ